MPRFGAERRYLRLTSGDMRSTKLKRLVQLRAVLTKKMVMLRETAEAVNCMHDLQAKQEDVLNVFFQHARRLLQATGISMFTIDEKVLKPVVTTDWPEDILQDILPTHLKCTEATHFLHNGHAVLLSTLESPSMGQTLVALVRSAVSPWRKIERWVFSSLLHSASAALKRVAMLEASKRQTSSLELLNQIGRTFTSSLSLEDLFDSIYHEVGKIMDTDAFFVALYDDVLKQIELRCIYDDGVRLNSEILPLNDGPTARAIKSKAPVHYNIDSSKIPGVTQFGDNAKAVLSILVVPILLQGEVIGALSAQGFSPNAHDDEDALILSTIANQAAIAIQNAKLYEQTLKMALTDNMTGLKNGRSFHQALDEALVTAQKNEERLSLIMIDSDSLKSINDRFGHLAGDEHICRMAKIIGENARPQDTVARYAGDEFMIVLPDTHLNEAKVIAERIVRTVRAAAYQGVGCTIHVTASAGVAEYPQDGRDSEELIRAADRAMYAAKGMGKNRTITTDEIPVPAC